MAEPGRRRLVFLGEDPYLVSIPKTGDASTMAMTIARLDGNTLAPEQEYVLDLWTPCYEEGYCNSTLLTGQVDIEPIAVTEAGLFGGAWLMIGSTAGA
jgi:hypothetical protein